MSMTQEDILMMKALIQTTTAEAVKETVNGKIDSMREILDEHITQHKTDMDELRPVAQAFATWSGWKRATMSMLLPIAGVTGFGASIAVIWEALKGMNMPR